MNKICIVTGTRAEYGILSGLIKLVHEDPELELQLVVTGMHLSPEFGLTWKEIANDGFPIARKVEMLLSSDTSVGVVKSMALGQISLAEAFQELKPDIIVLLGDRTETFAAASAALITGIPVAHIHGGEITEGAYDDAIRHSITKMSHLHFTSAEEYRHRVIQLGENPKTVFNVGAPGIDNILNTKLFGKEELENKLNIKFKKRNLLITFHPVTLEESSAEKQFSEVLAAVGNLKDTQLIFTKPNSDKGGRIIIQMIDNFVAENPDTAVAFTSLGYLAYLSAIPFVDAVVGNSSSGIIEVPVFNTPTVNIGDRQKGRITGPTIIKCEPKKESIAEALNKAFQFDKSKKWKHPYGNGTAASQILDIIKKSIPVKLMKSFYDIKA